MKKKKNKNQKTPFLEEFNGFDLTFSKINEDTEN